MGRKSIKENKNVYESSGREITWWAKVQSIQTKHIAPYLELHRDLLSSFLKAIGRGLSW